MAKPSNAYTDNSFASSDLKTILHSKRANIYYLSHCRVMQKVTQKFKVWVTCVIDYFITAQVTQKCYIAIISIGFGFITAQVTQKLEYWFKCCLVHFITAQVTQKSSDAATKADAAFITAQVTQKQPSNI